MNDFTKEELQALYWCVNPVRISPDMCDKLKDKIQSMIENYDEHDKKNNPMYKCIRCDSKEINEDYEIKYGLHDWFLCVECSPQFSDWVRDKHADNGCSWAKEHFKRKYGDK